MEHGACRHSSSWSFTSAQLCGRNSMKRRRELSYASAMVAGAPFTPVALERLIGEREKSDVRRCRQRIGDEQTVVAAAVAMHEVRAFGVVAGGVDADVIRGREIGLQDRHEIGLRLE